MTKKIDIYYIKVIIMSISPTLMKNLGESTSFE